jgi:hypothetical protein
MYYLSRATLLLAFLVIAPSFFSKATAQSQKDLTALCAKAGYSIQPKSEGFDLYLYQKAFLSFNRLDSFRLEDRQAVYILENGEASIVLASAAEMREKHGKKIESMGSKQPSIRFILNVNGQVKEQLLD